MDIRGLRYFIKLAECLNFTHAAKECFITQTAMSQSIAKMEEELGFKLFKRNNRSVELTPSGKYFYGSVYTLVKNYDEAVKYSMNLVEGLEGQLKISVSNSSDAFLIMDGFDEFRKKYPSIDLKIQIVEPYLVEEYTRKGRIDLSISWSNGYIGDTTYDNIFKITEFEPMVVVTKEHPLATVDSIKLDMLKNNRFKFADFKSNFRSMMDVLLKDSIKPQNVLKKTTAEEILLEIVFDNAIAILPSFMEKYVDERYVFKKIDEENIPKMPFEIRYSKTNLNPVLPRLFEVLSEIYPQNE